MLFTALVPVVAALAVAAVPFAEVGVEIHSRRFPNKCISVGGNVGNDAPVVT